MIRCNVLRACGAGGIVAPPPTWRLRTEALTSAIGFARRRFADEGTKDGDVSGSMSASSTNGALAKGADGQSLMVEGRAKPLELPQHVLLYQSDVNIAAVASAACARCRAGAVFAAVGFAGFVASLASTLPPVALCIIVSGAAANCYALATVAQRVIRKLAARHVERLVAWPTSSVAQSTDFPLEGTERGGVASIVSNAATVEERLLATPELRLELVTGSARRWFLIVDRSDGVLDDRASFGDICMRLSLLHVNLGAGRCGDHALLEALLRTDKVVEDERYESREGASDGGVKGAPIGPMLRDVMRAEILTFQPPLGAMEAPADAILKLGVRARNAGASMLVVGLLFTAGEGARDQDGVARYANLAIPGLD